MIKLSQTGKMPCKSWSIQAIETCNRGAKLAKCEGSICSICYASKNRYLFKPIKDARANQLAHWKESNLTDWTLEMVELIRKNTKKVKYFRWFDSGDIVDVTMLYNIVTIAKMIPDVKFWLPTRETGVLKEYFDTHDTCPENLIIRVSMDFIDESIARYATAVHDKWTEHVTFSTVITKADRHACVQTPKKVGVNKKGQDIIIGICGDCRRCWDKKNRVTSYVMH
jgi:hypothetical protein